MKFIELLKQPLRRQPSNPMHKVFVLNLHKKSPCILIHGLFLFRIILAWGLVTVNYSLNIVGWYFTISTLRLPLGY